MSSKDLSDNTTTNLVGVIAEIGNHHLGSVEVAKTMILSARRAGADFVKMQAIDPNVVCKTGSMPYEFYKECELTTDEYISCIQYGRTIGVTVFFSVFGEKHALVSKIFRNSLYKISGGQFKAASPQKLFNHNNHRTIVSIPDDAEISKEKATAVWAMQKMYVTPYLPEKVNWPYLEKLKKKFGRVGYSDHTPGVDNCKIAINRYGCTLLEKHFHLGTDIVYQGKRYRDCLHAATPDEFKKLTDYFKERLDAMPNLPRR